MGTERFLGKFQLRHATPRDSEALQQFFARNQHRNNAVRQDDLLIKQVKERNIFIVVGDGGDIHAAAGLFEHADGSYREFGATRVLPSLGGFNVQQILIAARNTHARVLELSPLSVFFATLRPGAVRSRENLENMGFVDWPNPDDALVRAKHQIANVEGKSMPQLSYLRLTDEAIYQHSRLLLDWDSEPHRSRTSRDDGITEFILVELSIEPLLYYGQDVEQFAAGRWPED